MRGIVLGVLALFLCGCGDDSGRIHAEAYAAKMAQFAAQPAAPGSTIIVGDSITDGWQTMPAGWDNRGIGMDTVADVVQRLPDHLENDRPSTVILLIGINRIEDSVDSWIVLLDQLKSRPDIKWYVVSLLPNSWDCGRSVPAFNAWLQEAVKGTATYIDVYSLFAADGRWGVLFYDGLHPAAAGYELLYRGLTEQIK